MKLPKSIRQAFLGLALKWNMVKNDEKMATTKPTKPSLVDHRNEQVITPPTPPKLDPKFKLQ